MNRRPCKHGEGCFKFMKGVDCGFSHDTGASTGGGYNPNPNPGFNPPNPGFNSPNPGFSAGSGGKRPCKFGMNCNDFKQGRCTFAHDNVNLNQPTGPMNYPPNPSYNNPGGMNPQPGSGTGPNPQACRFGDNCNNNKMGKCRYFHPPSNMAM
jgi:hypothetical protein